MCPAHCRVWHCGGQHTPKFDFAGSWTLQSLTLRGPAHHWVLLSRSCTPQSLTLPGPEHCRLSLYGVLHTAEFDFEGSSTLQSLTLRGPAHHWVWLCQVLHTADFDFVGSRTQQSLTQGWEFTHLHIAHLLRSNERLWAIRSDRSGQMSNCE